LTWILVGSSTSELATSLERVRYSSLTWRRCVRCVAAMCAVCRGAELSILPSLSTPTNWSLPSHNSPDSAHRHRLANVARGNTCASPVCNTPHRPSKQEREEQGVDLLTRIQTGASFPQPAVDHRVPARAALLARPLLLRATR